MCLSNYCVVVVQTFLSTISGLNYDASMLCKPKTNKNWFWIHTFRSKWRRTQTEQDSDCKAMCPTRYQKLNNSFTLEWAKVVTLLWYAVCLLLRLLLVFVSFIASSCWKDGSTPMLRRSDKMRCAAVRVTALAAQLDSLSCDWERERCLDRIDSANTALTATQASVCVFVRCPACTVCISHLCKLVFVLNVQ